MSILNNKAVLPANMTLLDFSKVLYKLMTPVSSTDINEGLTHNLHDEGLYSVPIFGRVGTKERDETESYIDIKLPIFNPIYLHTLIKLKGLYKGILNGSEYVIWDDQLKDFIKSNLLEGHTGYSFFMNHFHELNIPLNESYRRKQKIKFINEFKRICLTDKILVLPAGIRDIQYNPNGSFTEPEINDLYRKLIFKTRSISLGSVPTKEEINSNIFDNIRWGLQSSFNEIDDYIFNLLDHKRGIIQNKVNKRGVVGGSRNVITARKVSMEDADNPPNIDFNTVDIGLFQSLVIFEYVVRYCIFNGYVNKVFTKGTGNAKLVNVKTLEYEYVEVDNEIVDKWTSSDGLNKIINTLDNRELRDKPIMINNHYLGLVYDDGQRVKIIGDINEIPFEEYRNKKYVYPLTYYTLFYLECVKLIETTKAIQNTRFPIRTQGSIRPSFPNILTTNKTKTCMLLDDYWENDYRLNNFPIQNFKQDEYSHFFDAMSVDPSHERAYGSDHDGDDQIDVIF